MKKQFSKWCIAMFTIMVAVSSCSKQSEDKLQKNNSCDTTNVTYSKDVLTIIKANCYSCHGDGEADGGISLDGYTNLKIHADAGDLEGTINHAPGFPPMPENNPQLSDCDINIITAWINAGSPNN